MILVLLTQFVDDFITVVVFLHAVLLIAVELDLGVSEAEIKFVYLLQMLSYHGFFVSYPTL